MTAAVVTPVSPPVNTPVVVAPVVTPVDITPPVPPSPLLLNGPFA